MQYPACRRWIRATLLLAYLFFIAQCLDAEYAGTIADERRLDGGMVGWFGTRWLIVLLATVIVIVALHSALFVVRHKKAEQSSESD